MPSTAERAESNQASQVRQAFDIRLIEKRRREVYSTVADKNEADRIILEGVALDWQGFSWEYGFKKELRFTPYVNTYHQRVVNYNGELDFRMVAVEDLMTNEDFLPSLDPAENNGLVYRSFQTLKSRFIDANVGDSFFWASPKNEGFSQYSFAYYGRVEHNEHGKTLRVWNYYNDLSHEEFAQTINEITKTQTLAASSSLSEVATTIADASNIASPEDVWRYLASTRSDGRIAGATLEQVLNSNNPQLLAKVREQSAYEAISILRDLDRGLSVDQIQVVIGERLLQFVARINGESVEQVYRKIANNGAAEGSCGGVAFGVHGPIDTVVSEISATGVKRCKFCKKRLRYDQAYCMECKFC